MAIESGPGGTMITGSADITLYRHLAATSALALEINTGMRMSSKRSTMLAVAAICGSGKKTRRGVLRDMVAFMQRTYPQYETATSVQRALGA